MVIIIMQLPVENNLLVSSKTKGEKPQKK